MLGGILKKVFGSRNDREIKRIKPLIERISAFEPKMKAIKDDGFAALTASFKDQIKSGKSIDDLLPEAFAAVREASYRKLGMRHFDVQMMGGIVLHEGNIAEMKTGEGKTLVATLPLYLNALTGKGAHLVTVNDYLARRDSKWMGALYHALGLSVGVIQHEASFLYDPAYSGDDETYVHLRPVTRQEAYRADITYGTNNEFGFDYLRDNMKFSLDEYVQRELNFAIVDEVDSILIDEARTPLIISGPTEESTDKYYSIDRIIPAMKRDVHFTVDEKTKQVMMNDAGVELVEKLLNMDNLYDPLNIETVHHVNQALYAHVLKHRDVDYVVKDDQVIIVDEFTGRLMPGRRWSDGLHQAVEAKEKVSIENENQTLATITFQNYFRMYGKLAGMTGTADTEAAEFNDIYGLEVTVIPTNKPLKRGDSPDLVYRSKKDKFKAVLNDIKDWHSKGRPVLVGTISIDDSEKLSVILKQSGVRHHVLNAKQHEREAEIVAQAGRLGAVTISTNMAGRGTDILLGGNAEFLSAEEAGKDDTTEEYHETLKKMRVQCEHEKEKVIGLGGLHILGTERHESRRIDNQLRGRAGRQGDPGSSSFYLSLEDDLMRIFGSDRIGYIMDKIGMEEGVPIEHSLVTRAIEGAQKKVEAHNYDIRKHLLEYDDVMNQQREVVYGYRKQILSLSGLREMIKEFSDEVIGNIVDTHIEDKTSADEWDMKPVADAMYQVFGMEIKPVAPAGVAKKEALLENLTEQTWKHYLSRSSVVSPEIFAEFEKYIMLNVLDTLWKDHLLSMDHLKGGIGLRGYGQKNPLQEYKKEGFDLFADMTARFKSEVVERLYRVEISREDAEPPPMPAPKQAEVIESRGEVPVAGGEHGEAVEEKQKPVVRHGDKIGRNDPCPCGSGKKYKKCHGINDGEHA